jgi:bacterioferritin B
MAARRLSEERALPAGFMPVHGEVGDGTGAASPGAPGGLGGDVLTFAPWPDPQPPSREPHVIGKRLHRLLTRQVGAELAGQQVCLGVSLYFERISLMTWGRLFRDRAGEEAADAARIMSFLASNRVEFDLPELASAPTQFKSPARAVRAALDRERRMTAQVNDLARAAAAKGDGETLMVAQWLIERQAGAEREMRRVADLVASGINLFQAEALLDPCPEPTGSPAAAREA